ncbi:uncharacterized protein G2W53_041202 [Senna tora]|uniref:Uncharacterized protein n=1 Tax=Senna tora TaxID=362788 RepID=A0A834SFB8_9FABA|nr:uncharacterized protein G2W53_041202 [Senna tora]
MTKLRQFWEQVFALHPGSNIYGILGGDKGPLCIMSTDRMVVLSRLNLCPTQMANNSWTALCGFQLHCYRLKSRKYAASGSHLFASFRWNEFILSDRVHEVVEVCIYAIRHPTSNPLVDEQDSIEGVFVFPFTSLLRPDDDDTVLPMGASSSVPRGTGTSVTIASSNGVSTKFYYLDEPQSEVRFTRLVPRQPPIYHAYKRGKVQPIKNLGGLGANLTDYEAPRQMT